jgi:hypothetical protein
MRGRYNASTAAAKTGGLPSDSEKAFPGFFSLENRGVNPRFSPFSSRRPAGKWRQVPLATGTLITYDSIKLF